MGHTIGIDLGTTYSAAARVNELGKPELLVNRDGDRITPSVVLFQDELPIVGTMAKRSAATAPLDVVQFVKRSMGDPTWKFETSGGTSYRPEEISAIILRRLKDDAELVLDGEVTNAVITVPAYFDDAPRRATMDAGRIAGLDVRRVLNEPTAAALAYGIDTAVDGTVLVYDLGGGTFDVTVMAVEGGEFDVLATHGDRNLGGFDFDNLLMRLLDDAFRAAGGPSLLEDPEAEADLREKAEIAKRSLTTVEQTRVVLAAGGVTKVIPLTRAAFEDVTSSLLSRTRDIAEMVVDDAGLDWAKVEPRPARRRIDPDADDRADAPAGRRAGAGSRRQPRTRSSRWAPPCRPTSSTSTPRPAGRGRTARGSRCSCRRSRCRGSAT